MNSLGRIPDRFHMLGIAQNRDDASRCRYCGEKLSLLQRLSRAEYCNSQHRDAYHHDQEKLALGRLQPAPVERGPEALGRPKHGVAAPGEWPEEAAAEVVASHPVEVQRVNAPPTIVGVEYEEEDGAAADTPPLCGPICSDDVAASGRVSPIPSDQAPEEFGGEAPRMPESAVAVQAPRVQAIRSQQLGLTVPSLAGERLGAQQESGSEAPDMGMRFPALSIQSVDWSEALNRERQTWAGIPPLAGLIQIAGPQTLRFEARLRTPMALPEHPAGNPVRSYKPGLRGGGVPNLAGAIRGLGTWRTRFGSEGNLQPQWESGVVDMTVAAEWMPRYPVFYTTSPWASEGLEEIFGLGPGQGPGQGGLGIDPSATGAVMDLLENLGPGPGVSGGGFGPGAGGAVSVALNNNDLC